MFAEGAPLPEPGHGGGGQEEVPELHSGESET